MIKGWMIIAIACSPIEYINTKSNYCYDHMIVGSVFYTEKECLNAVKKIVSNDDEGFCVETMVKNIIK